MKIRTMRGQVKQGPEFPAYLVQIYRNPAEIVRRDHDKT